MRERIVVWSARAFLALLVLLALTLLLKIPVHHSDHFSFFGHIHSIGEGVGATCVLGVCLIALGALAIYLVIEAILHLVLIVHIALRQPHNPWRYRWIESYSGEKVTYKKPDRLVKGRIGSK